jgi:hypothetical protein
MMKRSALTVVALFCMCTPLHAQDPAAGGAANAVYVELLGNGGLYSLNYDRRFADAVALRVGFASWTTDDLFLGEEAETDFISVPVTAAWLMGTGNRRIELGGGVLVGTKSREEAFGDGETSSGFVSLTGIIGYRYQPARGFMFRVALTPFFGLGDEDEAYPEDGFMPSGGLSVGYSF